MGREMSYLWSKSQVESMLSSGLTDKDREDLEEIDKFLRAFIKDIHTLEESPDTWEAVKNVRADLERKYNAEDSEISLDHVIEEAVSEKERLLENKNKDWSRQYLEIDPDGLSH